MTRKLLPNNGAEWVRAIHANFPLSVSVSGWTRDVEKIVVNLLREALGPNAFSLEKIVVNLGPNAFSLEQSEVSFDDECRWTYHYFEGKTFFHFLTDEDMLFFKMACPDGLNLAPGRRK